MTTKWIESIVGSLEQKKQFKRDRARIDALPEPYRTVAQAMTRYLMYYGAIADGDKLVTMFTDFADLWERAAIDATPVRDIVGTDPVDFIEAFALAYSGRQWIDKERARLTKAIDDAIGPQD